MYVPQISARKHQAATHHLLGALWLAFGACSSDQAGSPTADTAAPVLAPTTTTGASPAGSVGGRTATPQRAMSGLPGSRPTSGSAGVVAADGRAGSGTASIPVSGAGAGVVGTVAGNQAGAAAGGAFASAGAGSQAGSAAVSNSVAAGRGGAMSAADSGSTNTATGPTPVFRIPLRVHTAMSELNQTELTAILREVNEIWLKQAGVCFEIEVTASEQNRDDGFDFRYTSGQIPIARGSNGVYQDAHNIWSVDHPRLNDVGMPVMNPTARTTAHELGHALGLAHENPPPSNDCSRPCHCVELGDDCDEYLMRSGSKGIFVSKPEIEVVRGRAPRVALSDQGPVRCDEPMFMP